MLDQEVTAERKVLMVVALKPESVETWSKSKKDPPSAYLGYLGRDNIYLGIIFTWGGITFTWG